MARQTLPLSALELERQQKIYNDKSNLFSLAAEVEENCWNLHTKLKGSYKNTQEQMNDMVLMGKKAALVEKLKEVACEYYELMKVQQ